MRVANLMQLLAAAAPVVRAAQGDSQPVARAELMSLRHSLHQRGLVDDIWNMIKEAATCGACESILVLLKGIAFFGDSAFVDAAKTLCKLGKIQDPDVCDGLLDREGPTVAKVINELSMYGRTQKLFCGAILGLCDTPAVQPLDLRFPSDKPNSGRPTPSGKKPLKVVHFSDIHVDHHYTLGSSTACNKPICCRAYTKDNAPGNTKNPAGPFGDHKCDTPVSLEQSMYKAIKEAVPDIAFALFTGDIVDHTIWNTTRESNIHDSTSQITD
ncbi:Metallophosphoesterase domain protein [Akanthomyces lecanii RCEF 1005]|uniref:Metallophosphoesterase domain protein n=1 Tax=Akanthomyces lecanii RCEF 1005 TaxID=1081108 RepID=A0A167THL7_CORDF|nr:Metallophosphoesterase domain protein [Akanthomyces lecanii RCEF 1005]